MKTTPAYERAMRNAMAYNKNLTKEYLLKLSPKELLCFVHPLDREGIRKSIYGQKGEETGEL